MNEIDILDLLKSEIREQQFVIFGLSYDAVDQKYNFPRGTTEEFIEQAAHECGYDVEVPEEQADQGWVALKRWSDGLIPGTPRTD